MSPYQEALLRALREAKPASVDGVFDNFISNEIGIPPGIREKASVSQNALRDFLKQKRESDSGFPAVLSVADREYLGGSFGRKTKIKPLDDIDLYVPLDGYGLYYYESLVKTSYTVLTDNSYTTNPLLTSRWGDGGWVSSSKLLDEFATAIRARYPKTKVRQNGQAISIQMTIGQSEESDGLGFDVVPCFSLKPGTIFGQHVYLIPDGRNGWLKTNPRLDSDKADQLNNANNKTFRKVVKLIKYWNVNSVCAEFGSYYIELAIAKAFAQHNSQGKVVGSISEGLALGFNALYSAILNGSQTPWLAGAPPVTPKNLLPLDTFVLKPIVDGAQVAWQRECRGDRAGALQGWAVIFGESFPKS